MVRAGSRRHWFGVVPAGRRCGGSRALLRGLAPACWVILIAVLLLGGQAGTGSAAPPPTSGVPCTPEQYNAAIAGKDCGATLRGPSSLALAPCKGSAERGLLCSQPFSLRLAVPGASNCTVSPPETSGRCLAQLMVSSVTSTPSTVSGDGQFQLRAASVGTKSYAGDYWCAAGPDTCADTSSQLFEIQGYSPTAPGRPYRLPARFAFHLTVSGEAEQASDAGWSPLFPFVAHVNLAAHLGAAPPSASLAVKITAPVAPSEYQAAVEAGDVVTVTVKVEASGGGFKDVRLTGDGITVGRACGPTKATAGGSVAVVTHAPPLASGFPLPAGSSRTFEFKLRGHRNGDALLAVHVVGTTSDGQSAEATADTEIRVGSLLHHGGEEVEEIGGVDRTSAICVNPEP